MPVIYETTAIMQTKGHLSLELVDLPFEEGTEFVVKLIPRSPDESELFKQRMRDLMAECARDTRYIGMTKAQIVAELRRQREEMYRE